jgi:hypothetical protein
MWIKCTGDKIVPVSGLTMKEKAEEFAKQLNVK